MMPRNRNLSDRRYGLGRAVMLTSACIYSLGQAARYLPNPLVSDNGPASLEFVTVFVPQWIWAGLWVVAAVLCAVDIARGVGRKGISLVVGLMFSWSALYLFSYINTVLEHGWGSREWVSVFTFGCTAGMVLGLLIKIGALKRIGEHE